MAVYMLTKDLVFPLPELAEEDGLLAIGGDLRPERLLLAYSMGIFPWFDEDSPIIWWSLDPRLVLFPDKLKVSASLRQTLRSGHFRVTFDEEFGQVIAACADSKRQHHDGTWIDSRMVKAYKALHQAGYAHSVEVWKENQLVGGLYGVSLGRIFFGESMFFRVSNASKVALWHLVERLREWDFRLIDAQQDTAHLRSLGAETISRKAFMEFLRQALQHETIRGNWSQ
ncbi:MAG: leucyl/phenylalanyl-tRNA--protein transferase [Clostridia bacterium]|nr:leucyl/phenylalanyl-tRNA--protein transferase [Clostridia bacterium]